MTVPVAPRNSPVPPVIGAIVGGLPASCSITSAKTICPRPGQRDRHVGTVVQGACDVDEEALVGKRSDLRAGLRVELLAGGMTIGEIVRDFPYIEEADILAVLAFAAENLEVAKA